MYTYQSVQDSEYVSPTVSVIFTVGVQGVCCVMALCSEACVSGSGGESSGSEVSFPVTIEYYLILFRCTEDI